uniref:Uncharacterized protein n=1 Tax=Arundo donax TaxID=35708 RepID=A0A0A9G1S2_ARUDO
MNRIWMSFPHHIKGNAAPNHIGSDHITNYSNLVVPDSAHGSDTSYCNHTSCIFYN